MSRKKDIYEFQGTGILDSELKWAKNRFKNYRNHYHIENFSSLQLLEELVVRETQHERLKQRTIKLADSKVAQDHKIIDWKLNKALDDNLDKIIQLKEKIGLFKNKEKEDLYNYIQGLKEKAKLYRKENPRSYSFPCPSCGKMIHAMVRVNEKTHIITEHPFFKNKFFNGGYLMELLEVGKLTKEEVAKAINVPVDYITHLIKHGKK